MWVIVHTLTGMALGSILLGQGYVVIVLAALGLHALLDLVPHWDYTRTAHAWRFGIADVAFSAAVLVVARAAFGLEWPIIVAGIVSALPDLDVLNSLLPTERRYRVFVSHWSRFPHGACSMLPGIAVQAAVAAAAILILVVA